jgi:hypothetical protein
MALAALTVSTAALGAEIDVLRAENVELARRLRELERRLEALRGPTRSAIEDYLDDRGITGLALTDADLEPLDRVLRRATLGAELRLRYERLEDFYYLGDSVGADRVDYSEIRTRLSFGYALAGGGEIEIEFQGLLPASGLAEGAVFQSGVTPTVLGPENPFAASETLEVRRAELRLPSINLLGRLARVPVTAVLGRQEIAFGSGFVLGRLDEEAGLTHDGFRVFGESGAGDRADVFWGRAASGAGEVVARAGGDPAAVGYLGSRPEVEITGVRGQKRGLLHDTTVAAYLLAARIGDVPASIDSTYPALPGTTVNTFGLEASADLTANSVLRFDGAVQWGDRGGADIRDAAAAELSLEWRGWPAGGKAYVAFATGDQPHTDAVYEGFTPLAQDVRGRWDELGLLSSSNCYLWGIRTCYGNDRGTRATFSVTRAFADETAGRTGLFVRDPAPGDGKEIGLFISASAEGRIFSEKDSRARISFTSFLPGDYFGGDAEAASFLSLEMKLGF